MGDARRRGTREQRIEQAIAAGQMKAPRASAPGAWAVIYGMLMSFGWRVPRHGSRLGPDLSREDASRKP